MSKRIFLSVAIAASIMSGAVLAQTCESPLAITSNSTGDGDTCTAGNPFPAYPGGIASPQNDIVYSFVAEAAAATITVSNDGSALLPGIVLVNPCDPVGGNIVAAGSNVGGTATIDVGGLTDGTTYYFVVTTDPGAGAAADNCGTFNYTVDGTLPVELQSFSVD